MFQIKKRTKNNSDFQKLTKALDQDLSITDGDEHEFYNQFNGLEDLAVVLIAYRDNQAIGCGAFKMYDEFTAEIKRMYVLPEEQGKGVASALLKELEKLASSLAYKTCILETGIRQPDAIALYKKNGYDITANYGPYMGVKNSLCFKKEL